MTDKTPIVVNDLSRSEQARKERETAAYLRRLADRADKLAAILEADAADDSLSAKPPVSQQDDPVPAFLAPDREAA